MYNVYLCTNTLRRRYIIIIFIIKIYYIRRAYPTPLTVNLKTRRCRDLPWIFFLHFYIFRGVLEPQTRT